MAGTELGSLYYKLNLDDENLKKGISSANTSVKEFGTQAQSMGDKMQSGFRDAAKALSVVSVGLTVYAKDATDFTVNLVKESKSLGREIGVTTEEASRLVAAFGRMGIGADAAQQMFGIFSKQIVAATTNTRAHQDANEKLQLQIQGTKLDIEKTTKAIKDHGDSTGALALKVQELKLKLGDQTAALDANKTAFDKLGISTIDANGNQKDFNTLLFAVADKFKAMPDGIDKTTLSMQLFGRSGKDMVKVLDLGSQGIADLEKQADKLGLTLSAETIGNVAKLIQSQKDLKEQTDALKIAVGTATAPALTNYNKGINQLLTSALALHQPFHSIIVDFLAFGGPVAGAGASMAAFLGNISSINGEFGKLLMRFGVALIIFAAIAGALYLLVQHFGGLHNTILMLHHLVDGPFNAAMSVMQNVMYGLSESVRALWNNLVTHLAPAFEQIFAAVQRLWAALEPGFTTILKVLAVVIGVLLYAAILAAINILNIIVNVFSFVISAVANVIGWISNLIGWFGNLVGGVWNAINTVISIFRNLPGAFSAVVGLIGAAARALPGVILSAVGDLGSLLYHAGASIISGLVRGIESQFGAVKQTLGNLTSKLTSWKGPASVDSTILEGSGRLVIGGFVRGLESQYSRVQNSLGGLTDSLALGANLGIEAGAAGSGGGGTNNVNNYHIAKVELATSDAVREFFGLGNRSVQLQNQGIAPLAGTTGV